MIIFYSKASGIRNKRITYFRRLSANSTVMQMAILLQQTLQGTAIFDDLQLPPRSFHLFQTFQNAISHTLLQHLTASNEARSVRDS